jgi:hypothetical protein
LKFCSSRRSNTRCVDDRKVVGTRRKKVYIQEIRKKEKREKVYVPPTVKSISSLERKKDK